VAAQVVGHTPGGCRAGGTNPRHMTLTTQQHSLHPVPPCSPGPQPHSPTHTQPPATSLPPFPSLVPAGLGSPLSGSPRVNGLAPGGGSFSGPATTSKLPDFSR
jgi:hypothetical protein